MLARLTDWKPTIIGLLIAAVIIAALVTRPEWGAPEIAQLVGGVAAALLGAWARSSAAPAAEKPAAPTVPPVVGGLLLALGGLVLAGALTGCAHPLDTAVRAANGARAVGESARTAITAACVPAYKAANTAAQLAAVDARCLPAERAYVALAVAHAAAVVELQRAQLGQVTAADALAAAQAVGRAGADLAAAVKAVGQ